MFDSVILLTKGNVAYFGPSRSILDHFAKIGHACPNDTNPADFLRNALLLNYANYN